MLTLMRPFLLRPTPTFLLAAGLGLLLFGGLAETAQADPGATIRAYGEASRGEREQLLDQLGRDRARSLGALRSAAAHGDVDERVFAVRTLGEMRDPGSLGALLAATADPSAKTRKHAAAALRRLGDASAVPRLRELVVATQERGLLKVALVGLGELGGREDIPRVRPFLSHPEGSVRVTAAGVLAMLGNEEGLSLLLAATQSDDPVVQKNATFALGYSRSTQARDRIEAILGDPAASWRSQAAMALTQRSLTGADDATRARRLGELVRGSDKQVSSWALARLAATDAPEAARELAAIEAQGGRIGRQALRRRALLGVR